MPAPRPDQRRDLFTQMQAIVKETGPFTGFRRSDLMHDKTFILKHWTGEPLLWMPYLSGTHLMRLGNMTVRQRNDAMKVIDHMLTQEANAHFFLIEGPGFAPREIAPRMIRDEAMDLFEGHRRDEPYEDEREGLERRSFRSNADYYVWPLGRENVPLAGYGPYGPFDMTTAKTYARARSQEGTHDSAVSRGADPQRFDIVRIYRAGTGQRIFPEGAEGFEANESQREKEARAPEGYEVYRDSSDYLYGWKWRPISDPNFRSYGHRTRKAARLAAWRFIETGREN